MYHYVRPIQGSRYPMVKGLETEAFLRQLDWFKQRYWFISANQLLQKIYNQTKIRENSISLSFDDGLKDHFTYVFPILKKEKIQGMFFITGEQIDKSIVLSVHKIQFILQKCGKSKILKKISDFINENKTKYDLMDFGYYQKKLATIDRFDDNQTVLIKRILQVGLPSSARKKLVDCLFSEYVTNDEKSFSKELYLSMDNIKEMSEDGMYFGSHGYSHEWFEFTDLNYELSKTVEFFSKINNDKETWIIAYPSASYNSQIIKKLSKLGFKAGLVFEGKDAILDKEHAFTLTRYDTNDFPQ